MKLTSFLLYDIFALLKKMNIIFKKIKNNGLTLKKLDKTILLFQEVDMIVNKVVLDKDNMRFSVVENILVILKVKNLKNITVNDN